MVELTYRTVLLDQRGSTWWVRLDRPEAENAINEAMVQELTDVLVRASESAATVVVLEGLPEVFCPGADFGAISAAAQAAEHHGGRTAADPEPLFELLRLMAYGDVITVAHVRGRANAGGVGLVAASDLVIADDTASFGLSELIFGLVPAIVLPFLIRRTGFQHAHYLAGTTQTVGAARAREWGLVDAHGEDSGLLLRQHLQRLARLSKPAVRRYKSYLRELSPIPEATKRAALAMNRLVFEDPENVRGIQRFAQDGVFPWEGDRVAEAPVGLPPGRLGDPRFRETHGLKYNYVAGGMYQAIASVELVVAMGRAGLLAFFGTGGLGPDAIEDALLRIGRELDQGEPYGMNLLHSPQDAELEMRTVELYLRHRVRTVEASAYIQPSPALVRYRLTGLARDPDGRIRQDHRIIAKVSRTEVAELFLRPPPTELVRQLVDQGLVTREQAELAVQLPLAQDLCVEADSAGHTDRGNPYVLMPAVRVLRDRVMVEQGYLEPVRIGAAGGIGTPEAALAAFALGADFIVTGSINQCTVEAGTSDEVKDILQQLGVHDTDYAPAGDMFEVGAQVQAVKRGLLFPVRAQKLYELYLRHDSIDDLDVKTRTLLEARYFKRPVDAVWQETRAYLAGRFPERLAVIERSPKQKMAQIFRWYFVHSTRLALSGSADQRVDYQIHCGPALGAFNDWVRGTALEPWRHRRVDVIAERLMQETAALAGRTFAFSPGPAGTAERQDESRHSGELTR